MRKVLEGKAVVVTGAGRGIGEAYARLAAEHGASVVVNDVDAPEAERVASAIRESGGRAFAKTADISSWDGAEGLVAACVAEYGALDGFVSNAAVFHMATFEEENERRLRRLVEINVLGSAFCGLHALRRMAKQGSGSLINVTSGSQCGIKAMFAYGGSKGAVASMTYAWALDVAGTGVRVNAISPMGASRMSEGTFAYYAGRGEVAPSRSVEIPAENNAPVVVYLLSDDSRDVHGQVVRIQGPYLNIMTHPAARAPGVEREKWAVADVKKAFDAKLEALQVPCGVQAYEVKLKDYSVPYPREKTVGAAEARKKATAGKAAAKKATSKKAGAKKPVAKKRAARNAPARKKAKTVSRNK